MIKKIISIILVVCMAVSITVPVFADVEDGRIAPYALYDHRTPNDYDAGWRSAGFTFPTHGRMMPFRPEHNYVSEQNPPDFMWPLHSTADSYDLIVCSDPELKDVVYHKEGITTNFYNFDVTFETGVNYWWAVRFNIGVKNSGWSDARRFRIQPNAYEFVSTDIETLMSRIPEGHPRVYTTAENLDEFRALADTNEQAARIRSYYVGIAERELLQPLNVPEDIPMPTEEERKNDVRILQKLRGNAAAAYSPALNLAFAYLLTGDQRYARRSLDIMLACCKWDVNGATSYKTQDQIHREIMMNFAMGVDWCWDVATPEERQIIIEHVLRRMDDMERLLDSIPTSPYDSHGWTAYGFIAIAGVALYGETPRAEKWLRSIIPTYTAVLPPWGYQDGGWSQGTGYYRYSTQTNRDPMDVFKAAGITDLYGKAWIMNEPLWALYAVSPTSYGTFGDEAHEQHDQGPYRSYHPELFYGIAANIDNEQVAGLSNWIADHYGFDGASGMQMYMNTKALEKEAIIPYDYPLSHEFSDIGWVVMTDDLISKDKIQMTFKSSHWGSFNHSQADQNSFYLQAYGEELAGRGGYYDAYHTTHDSGFTRKTGAHNSVTMATNRGQTDDEIHAKGEITAYLNHMDFDLATGDATAAYKTNRLDYFERHIIYIRPDIFVVVDDLDSYRNKKEKYEWWLNADVDMEVYEGADTAGCRVVNGVAALDTTVQYPKNITTYYNNIHALSDMIEIPAAAPHADSLVQRRVWFETEPLESTKMIVTMDVHKSDEEARSVDTQYYDEYVKMTFEDGTVLIVNINTDETKEIVADNITFTGAAVAYNDESIMLVSGTSLKEGGVELIKSEGICSVVMGKDELGISTFYDNRITINSNCDYVSGVAEVKNTSDYLMDASWGMEILNGKLLAAVESEAKKEDEEETAAKYELADNPDYTTFVCAADNYTLAMNGKSIKSDTNIKGNVEVYIDGIFATSSEIGGYTKRDGTAVYNGEIVVPPAKYEIVSITRGTNFGGFGVGEATYLTDVTVTSTTEKNVVHLKTIPTMDAKILETNGDADADTLKPKLAAMVEAEDATKHAQSASVYTTRSFLSGGKGVQLHNTPGQTATYNVSVKEAGYYDLAVKYVAWDSDNTKRGFTIAGKTYIIPLPKTEDWGTIPSTWKYVIADTNVYLEPGDYVLTIEAMEGMWNYDYLGLVKRN